MTSVDIVLPTDTVTCAKASMSGGGVIAAMISSARNVLYGC